MNFHGAAETPAYLEAPDNEDTEGKCECGEDVYEDGRFDWLCYECNDEACREAYYDDLADRMQDREWFPEDYDDYDGGY